MRWRGSCFFSAASAMAFFCATVLMPRANVLSQEGEGQAVRRVVPECKLADLDSDVLFFRDGDEFILAFNRRNISEGPCIPRTFQAGPLYDQEQLRDVKPFGECIECEDRLPNGEYRVHNPLVLEVGETGYQTYRWKRVASSEAVKCLKLYAVFGPVLTSAPSLLDQVCSEIAVSRTYPGTFMPPAQKGEQRSNEGQASEVMVLSSHKPRYYQDEMFPLHVSLATSARNSPTGEECPVLFLRQRSPDGATRFDEVTPSGFRSCKTFWLGSNHNEDWQTGFEVDSGVGSRWTGIGEHSFELFELSGSSRDGRIQFVHSNQLSVQIDDPATIARKWQGKAKGVGVDVTLDKEEYKLGEDVPLHIAIENFDAHAPIYAIDPTWDPYPAIGVEVRDTGGRLLAADEKFPTEALWTGHGRGPVPYAPGKIVTIERTLAEQGWLPNRPGVYTIAVTWCTLDGTEVEPGSALLGKSLKTYANVQAVTTFRVVGETSRAPARTLN